MKQHSLPLAQPEIRRQCSWGTCDNDFAYRIDDNDFCYAHGAMILEKRATVSCSARSTDVIDGQITINIEAATKELK